MILIWGTNQCFEDLGQIVIVLMRWISIDNFLYYFLYYLRYFNNSLDNSFCGDFHFFIYSFLSHIFIIFCKGLLINNKKCLFFKGKLSLKIQIRYILIRTNINLLSHFNLSQQMICKISTLFSLFLLFFLKCLSNCR